MKRGFIEGLIGSGKNYVLDGLKEKYNIKIHKQSFSNSEEIQNFYENKQNIKELQIFIFNSYKDQWDKEIENKKLVLFEGIGSCQDVFTEMELDSGKLSEEDYLFIKNNHSPNAHKMIPDFYIYLWCSTKTCLRRIEKRGMFGEKNVVDEKYLNKMKEKYNILFDLDENELINLRKNKLFINKTLKNGSRLIVLDNDDDDDKIIDFIYKLIKHLY